MVNRIPTYTRSVGTPDQLPATRAAVVDTSADPIAQATARLGQESLQLAGEFEVKQKRDAENIGAVQVSNVLSDGTVYWQQNLDNRMKSYKVGDEGLVENLKTDFSKWQDDTEAKLPTEKSKQYFRTHTDQMRASLQESAYKYQEKATAAKLNADTHAGEQADENLVFNDHKQVDPVYVRRMETVISRSDLTEGQKIEIGDKYRRKLYFAAERGQLDRDPTGWYRERFGDIAVAPLGASITPVGGVTTTPAGPVRDSLWKAQINQESSGKQFGDDGKPLTSSKGAVGVAQVMPDTGPIAAKLAGVPWDLRRYYEDAGYNEALGKAYMAQQLRTFGGDERKALAAYNMGPGSASKGTGVAGLVKTYGEDWLSHAPDETQKYVARISARAGAVNMTDIKPAPVAADVSDIRVPPDQLQSQDWEKRPDGTSKGNGFLGALKRPDGGVSTEITVGVNLNGKETEIPSLVPTLTRREVDALLTLKGDEKIPDAIVQKAVDFAKQRIKDGKDVFAGPDDIPGAARQPVQPKTYSGMDWEHQAALKQAAEVKIKQGEASFKANTDRIVHDAVAMHRDGMVDDFNLTRGTFDRAYGADGARLYQEYKNSQAMAIDVGKFKTQSVADIAAELESTKPQPGIGYGADSERYNNRLRAASQIMEARHKDPAGYATLNNPDLKQQRKDIDSMQSNAPGRPSAVQRFVSDNLAEQQRLGIQVPYILTPAEVDQIARRAMSATKPEDSANLISSLEADYGPRFFPQVFSELVKGEKISAELLIIPNLPSQTARETVSRLARVHEKDLIVGIDHNEQKAVKEGVTAHMESFAKAVPILSNQSAGVINSYATTIRKQAYAGIAAGQKPADAVEYAYKMVLGQYDFDETARYPKGADIPIIRAGREIVMKDRLADIDVPRDVTGSRSPEDARKEWTNTVQARPLWYTSDDDSGMELWANGNNGVRYRVTRGGVPVKYTWNDLKGMLPSDRQQRIQSRDSSVAPVFPGATSSVLDFLGIGSKK